jgi:antitoxin MazE
MSTVSLKKWGNSVGVRIPAAFLKEAHLNPGEKLDINLNEDGALVLTPTKSKQRGWLEQFNAIADGSNQDEIIDFPNKFDEQEWTW